MSSDRSLGGDVDVHVEVEVEVKVEVEVDVDVDGDVEVEVEVELVRKCQVIVHLLKGHQIHSNSYQV